MHLSRLGILSLAIYSVSLCQCVAVVRTPALSSNAADGAIHGGVAISSGRFQRPHEIIGLMQMNQEGFRTTFFGEVNDRATKPAQILQTIGRYAKSQGADGIQHFSLRLQNPRSKDEENRDKILGALEIVAAIATGDHGRAAGKASEGETTKYFIKGELVRWQTNTRSSTISASSQE